MCAAFVLLESISLEPGGSRLRIRAKTHNDNYYTSSETFAIGWEKGRGWMEGIGGGPDGGRLGGSPSGQLARRAGGGLRAKLKNLRRLANRNS